MNEHQTRLIVADEMKKNEHGLVGALFFIATSGILLWAMSNFVSDFYELKKRVEKLESKTVVSEEK